MQNRHALGLAAAIAALGLVAGGTAVAVASSKSKAVSVCVTKGGIVRTAKSSGKCPSHTHKQSIAVKGPAGPRGKTGPKGAAGTAVAWGTVNGYALSPTVVAGSSNIASVSRVQTGEYCVTFSTAIPLAERESAVVSPVYAGSLVENLTFDDQSACPNGIDVWNAPGVDNPNVPTSNANFTFIVP